MGYLGFLFQFIFWDTLCMQIHMYIDISLILLRLVDENTRFGPQKHLVTSLPLGYFCDFRQAIDL